MKVTYTSDDGRVFDSERECLAHECWTTDAFRSWEAWARDSGGDWLLDYGDRWKQVYAEWLAEDPDITPGNVVWDALNETLGRRGAWICREPLIAIGEAQYIGLIKKDNLSLALESNFGDINFENKSIFYDKAHPCGIVLGRSLPVDSFAGKEFYRVRFGDTTYERIHPVQMEIINEV